MADDTRKQVNVDLTRYPELYEALIALETELDTDKSKLIRGLIREKAKRHGHLGGTKKAVTSDRISRHV